jgi:hypothetical protein
MRDELRSGASRRIVNKVTYIGQASKVEEGKNV